MSESVFRPPSPDCHNNFAVGFVEHVIVATEVRVQKPVEHQSFKAAQIALLGCWTLVHGMLEMCGKFSPELNGNC